MCVLPARYILHTGVNPRIHQRRFALALADCETGDAIFVFAEVDLPDLFELGGTRCVEDCLYTEPLGTSRTEIWGKPRLTILFPIPLLPAPPPPPTINRVESRGSKSQALRG